LEWKQQQSTPGQVLPEVSLLTPQLLSTLQGIQGHKDGHGSCMARHEAGTCRAGAPASPSRAACGKGSCIPGEWGCVCNPCCLRERLWVNVIEWVGVTRASEVFIEVFLEICKVY